MLRFATVLFILTTASQASADLIAHYEFEGNGNDSSGNSLDGTINGSTTTVAGARTGLGNALQFNDSSMTLPGVGQLQFGSSAIPDFSAAFWFRTDAVPNANNSIGIISNWHTTSNRTWGMFLGRAQGSTPGEYHASQVDGGTGTSSTFLSNTRVDDGVWRHFAYVRDTTSSDVSIYLDGILAGSVADPTTDVFSGHEIIISGYQNTLYTFQMDDLRLYDHALSGADVTNLASISAVPEPSSFAILVGFCGLGLGIRRRRSPANSPNFAVKL